MSFNIAETTVNEENSKILSTCNLILPKTFVTWKAYKIFMSFFIVITASLVVEN